ncbi:hypothetical protein KY290_017721 [Solanum tuberosum]|uniref:Uncharacterized protein n=1 Tax=Solanum tuberosum TaxID=4113 RepID=A0ABQ7VE72_SOLTU|nr:hypothetical protein KY285_016701 [Solanum tuberosum]KAH0761648.1 hypothetical protein KY290_017721 [Solanum tuberosum]
MVVACCRWVSRAHGVEDVRGGFSVSMRRRRKGCFRCGSPEFLVGEGRWVEGSRPVGSIWVFSGDILAGEKRQLFFAGVGWFQVGLVAGQKVDDGGCESGKK